MKLQNQLIAYIGIVFIISLSFIGILVFSNSKTNLQNQIENQLQSISSITEKSIENYIEGQKSKIELIATRSDLTNEELIEMVNLNSGFYDLFVIDSNGIVIRSSNPARIGLDRSKRDYFVNARQGSYVAPVYFALVPQEYSIAVSTPFHGGVLVGSIKLDVLSNLVSDRAGLGETGETLLAFMNEKEEIVYFGPRLFSDEKVEVLSMEQVKGRPIYYAINREERIVESKDYRGEEVIAATNYIEIVNISMATKIDSKEAFSTIQSLQRTTIFIVFMSVILILFVVYIIARNVSKEVEEITSDIESITKGNLEVQLKKGSVFEIQRLVDSLNRILASMKLAILRAGISKEDIGIGEAMKAKEEIEEKYKAVYENSSDAIMALEPPSWKFTAGNPTTIKMFGAKNEKDFTSRAPWEFSPKKQPDGSISATKAKRMIEKAMAEGKVSFDWVHKRLSGEEFNAEVTLVKVKEKGKEYLQANVKDLGNVKGDDKND